MAVSVRKAGFEREEERDADQDYGQDQAEAVGGDQGNELRACEGGGGGEKGRDGL